MAPPNSLRRLKTAAILAFGGSWIACEVALDFDRSKIESGVDASFGVDAPSPPDPRGSVDAQSDTGMDAGQDAFETASPVEGGADATDADANDAGVEASGDAEGAADASDADTG